MESTFQLKPVYLPVEDYLPANARAFMAEYQSSTIPSPVARDERISNEMLCIFHCEADGDIIRVEGLRSVIRGKGFGSAGLKWLCDLADTHDVILELIPYPFGQARPRLSKQQLIAWYHRHGFQGTKILTRLPLNSK